MVTIEGDADGFAVSRLSAQGEVMAQVRFVTKQDAQDFAEAWEEWLASEDASCAA